MFRFGLKFPYHGLPRFSRRNPSKLYLSPRYYADKISPDPVRSRSKGGTGFKYTVGTLTLATVGTVAYAAYDKDFRRWMGNNVPYSDDFLKVLLQEEATYLQQLQKIYDNLTSSVYDSIFGSPSKEKTKDEKMKLEVTQKEQEKKDYKPPKPVFPAVAEQDECPDKAWKEIRVIPEKGAGGDEPQVVAEIDKPIKEETDLEKLPATHPRNLMDLENRISAAAVAAVASFGEASSAIRDYSKNVFLVIEHSTENLGQDVWNQLKDLVAQKEETVKKAETAANEALQGIEKMKSLFKEGLANVSDDVIDKANRNVDRILKAVEESKKEFEEEKQKTRITEMYWSKVEEARKYFEEELKILFPTIRIDEKDMKLGENELDLFIRYALRNILYFQKELKRLETLGEERLRAAIDKADDVSLVRAKVESELEKESRDLEQQFQKRALQLRAEGEAEVRQQLRRQAQAHSDHVADVLAVKEAEMERELKRIQDEKLAAEKAEYKMQLAAMLGRMRGIDDALRARAENDKLARQAQLLWSACQSLHRSLKNVVPGVPWQQQLRPLKELIDNVSKAANADDELVNVVITGIPTEAKERGVYTEDAMRERFLKVEHLARRLALVPAEGGSLPLYLLSYMQSFLLIKAVNPMPAAELADEPMDVSQLDTYDILERARYWMDRGDFSMTLRYMNQLKGASRCVAREWMNEVRILLETQQAANTLMAHAASSGLLYV